MNSLTLFVIDMLWAALARFDAQFVIGARGSANAASRALSDHLLFARIQLLNAEIAYRYHSLAPKPRT